MGVIRAAGPSAGSGVVVIELTGPVLGGPLCFRCRVGRAMWELSRGRNCTSFIAIPLRLPRWPVRRTSFRTMGARGLVPFISDCIAQG